MYKKAFLFNGIGTKSEKLLAMLTPEMYEKYEEYRKAAFTEHGLSIDPEKNTGYNAFASEWMVPFLCDKVIYEYLTEKGITPDIGAGYSSGIVSATACFGAMSHEKAYEIVMSLISMFRKLDEDGVKLNMGIVIGFSYNDLKELLSGFSEDELVIGSSNSSFHNMISGKADAVEKAIELCTNEGAIKAFVMNTGTAFHHPIMKKYSVANIELCGSIEYKTPEHPLISVFDQTVLETAEDIRRDNVCNVYSQMRWDLALKKLEELGVTEFFDLSANGAVKKFSRVSRKCRFYTLEDIIEGKYEVK